MLFKISFEVDIEIPNMTEENWNDFSDDIEHRINAYLEEESAQDEYHYKPVEE